MSLEKTIADIGIETLCEQLGVPHRVFLGGGDFSLQSSQAAEWIQREEARIAKLREMMTTKIVTPLIEKQFPELFWELAFTMSPSIKVYKRRERTLEVTWEN